MIEYFFTGLYIIAEMFFGVAIAILLAIFPIIIWGITSNPSWTWLYCIHLIVAITCVGYEDS